MEANCQYIDSSTTVAISNSTPEVPWRTLTEVLNSLSNNGGFLTIINHLWNLTVDMAQTATLNNDILIKYPPIKWILLTL